MFPHSTHPHANKNRHQTRTPTSTPSVISSSSIRYATPASLPPAFGIEPLHMWENSVATSTPSRGAPSSYANSEFGARYTPNSRMFSPQTPISTAEWVEQTSSVPSSVYTETRSTSKSHASTVTPPIRAPNFGDNSNYSTEPRYASPCYPVPDDSALNAGNFDVNGSIPSSGEEEDKNIRPASKYIDDEAQETSGKRKRKRSKPQSSRQKAVVDDAGTASSEEEPNVTKRRKATQTSSAPKKKATRKAAPNKPTRSPNKSNQRQSHQVESEVEDEESSSDGPFVPPASKASRSGRATKPMNPLSKWSGLSQGVLQFFPRLPKMQNTDTDPTPLWTYSSDGVTRQSPNHRALGCIHFSPSLALGEEFHYWVQVGTKEGGYWELYNPGRQHPAYPGYILQGCAGEAPPCWLHPTKP
ncbi:hypothetical protein FRC09_016542 [Ceratobasidium sp. 395]|nr:hypothetical protein FRC09_016542 [Ceratobasidium sp. 395]